MYTLMEVLETEQEELREEGEEDLPIGEEEFLSDLRPLIDIDAHLFALSQSISQGVSHLFLESRREFGLPHRARQRWQQDLVTLSTSGQYKEADTGYERALGRVPIEVPEVAELWLGRAQNEQRWGKTEAKAGRREVAREHLTLAVDYAERAIALAPKNRRYLKVLTSIQRALEAFDLT
jgi:hypothetical protein